MSIFEYFTNPKYFVPAAVAAFLIFVFQFYLMLTLPGTIDFSCVEGANLTFANIIFASLTSVLSGMMIAGFAVLYGQSAARRGIQGVSLSAIGLIFGTFTVFCTVCTLPVISLFGLSIGLQFFTYHNFIFKVVSTLLLFLGMYFLNRQLKLECSRCVKGWRLYWGFFKKKPDVLTSGFLA